MSAALSIAKTLSGPAPPARPGNDGHGRKTNGQAAARSGAAPAAASCPIPLTCGRCVRRPLISRSAATAILNSTDDALDMAIERGEFPFVFNLSGGKHQRCLRILSRHVLAYKAGLPIQNSETLAAVIDTILPHRPSLRTAEIAYWFHVKADTIHALIKTGCLQGAIAGKRRNGYRITRASAVQFLTKNRVT